MRNVLAACLILLSVQAALAKGRTKLPKKRPANFTVSYGESGGMVARGFSINLAAGSGTYTRYADEDRATANFAVDDAELDALYAVFRANGFDRIRTKKTPLTRDRAGAAMLIIVGQKSYSMSEGARQVLDPRDAELFGKVTSAVMELAQKKSWVSVTVTLDPSVKGAEVTIAAGDGPAKKVDATLTLFSGPQTLHVAVGAATTTVEVDGATTHALVIRLDGGAVVVDGATP